MALKPCIECSAEVSTDADRCPRCGVKNPSGRRTPGQVLMLVAFGFMVVTMMSRQCSSGTTTASNTLPSPDEVVRASKSRDSAERLQTLAAYQTADIQALVSLEYVVHKDAFPLPADLQDEHAAVHEHITNLWLDSAEALLGQRRFSPTDAQRILTSVVDPLTQQQRSRLSTLSARADATIAAALPPSAPACWHDAGRPGWYGSAEQMRDLRRLLEEGRCESVGLTWVHPVMGPSVLVLDGINRVLVRVHVDPDLDRATWETWQPASRSVILSDPTPDDIDAGAYSSGGSLGSLAPEVRAVLKRRAPRVYSRLR
jgi:hypothetical protein